jgi:catechol 2,3-dioxygenase-like lactoylglutathione lyase family enzyme
MLSYITLGAGDLPRSAGFYAAVLVPLGYIMREQPDGIALVPPGSGTTIYLVKPFDARPPTPGNGAMAAFQAPSQAMVRALHAAGLAAGGTDEGAPGFRAQYSAGFYVAYLRDPVGNKLALFSNNPAEAGRPA